MNFPYRYVAQITVEAISPLAIGSDSLAYDQDSPVDKDFNGLPYIPGTAITGYLKKQLDEKILAYFGEDPDSTNDEPKGSNIIISDAFLMDENGKVLQQPTSITSDFLKHYFKLPIRQHTAINAYGAAKDNSKFDTEIVFKGSRFKFEVELQLEKETNNWHTILNTFFQNNFYLGAGEFNNFGELKVVEIKEKAFNLKTELDAYLNHDVNLNTIDNKVFKPYTKEITKDEKPKYNEEKIKLTGNDSFFHFGAGYGDHVVDNINYSELVIEDWETGNPNFKEKYVIPGTSIKGALSHRVAFHYNVAKGKTVESLVKEFESLIETDLNDKYNTDNFELADNIEALEQQKTLLEKKLQELEKEQLQNTNIFNAYIGESNKGVSSLFGTAKNSKNKKGAAGTVIIKDIYLPIETPQTIFYHNKIDRYTGGTIDTALFNEKVLTIDTIDLCYKYKKKTDLTYLYKALENLKKGTLPIGGLVNKGHGIFVEHKNTENENN